MIARRALPDVAPGLLAGVDRRGRRHFLVALGSDEPAVLDYQSRGVSLATRDLDVEEHGTGRYMDLACQDVNGHAVFDVVGIEIAEGMRIAAIPLADLVPRILAKWRRFWGQATLLTLTREQQLGLFGELWFLSTWLLPKSNWIDTLQAWTGPLKARHDVAWNGIAIEVKTSSGSPGLQCRVHGLAQLETPEAGPLRFFLLRVREDATASNSLASIVDRCTDMVARDPIAADLLSSRLVSAGYDQIHREEYDRMRLTVLDQRLYRVEQDFPRLVAGTFVDGVPAGVDQIEYQLSLAGFDHLIVARTQADWDGG